MRAVWRALCALICGGGLAVSGANAATYTVRVRWQASSDTSVAGYHVYDRTTGGAYGAPMDAGMPASAGDGTLTFDVPGMDVRTDYVFALKSYAADGTESDLSNEVAIGYADVASSVDSDGDGLSDAAEDKNLNRVVDPGETDPLKADTDGDGVGDAQDGCQGTPAGAAVNANGCACSQVVCDDGNACNGVETCTAGVCRAGTAPNCDDGNACTTDSCSPTSGCTHTPIAGCTACTTAAQCDDANACTTDTCQSGTCRHAAAADGTSCSDGNACNGAETCQAGQCKGGTPLVCNDNNPCTTDNCDPTRGCVFPPKANGTSCSDGNACNGAETCQAGICTAGTPPTCNDGNPCTTDSCDPTRGCVFANNTNPCADDGNACTGDVCAGGQCTHPAAANGTSCSDGNPCNGAETCQAGACRAGTAPSCDDGNPCTDDSCSPTGGCIHSNNTAPCADDGNSCTADVCAAGQCTHPPVTDGTSCVGGDACTTGTTCHAGACGAGTSIVCDDHNPCTTDSCDPAKGCVFANNTIPCPDDGNACTADVCGGGACTHPALTNGTSCDDGNPCNGAETCQAGTCRPGTPPSCDDGNPCTDDSCSPTGGCVHTPNTAPCADDGNSCTTDVCAAGQCTHPPIIDGTACHDANACSGGGTCKAGVCNAGTPIVCDDHNPCTTDTCDPVKGCVFTNNTNPCADDGNACTADVCTAGACTHPAVANGTSCSDGNPCNGEETCSAGKCTAGSGPICDDGNPCTDDGCSPTTGCVHVPNTKPCADDGNACTGDVCAAGACTHPLKAEGSTCRDATACNTAGTCHLGTCSAGTPVVCDDHNPCTTDSCDAVKGCVFANNTNPCADDGNVCTADVCSGGACTHPAVTNGTSCGDGNACNGDETCQAGTCRPGTAPSCDDHNPCTDDSCSPTGGCIHTNNTKPCADDGNACTADVCRAGACTHPAVNDGAVCRAADACTGPGTCHAGVCASGTPISCDDKNPCTDDGCSPTEGCVHVANTSPCTDDGNPCTTDVCTGGVCAHPSKPNGATCADANACNGTETCRDGVCSAGVPLVCNDDNPCTTDTCDPARGCVFTNNSNPCADDGNPCTADVCALGRCSHARRPDGTTCGGDVCSGIDVCKNGRCTQGARADCDDGNPCTTDACDPSGGCTHTPIADGSRCGVGAFCNAPGSCQAGECQLGAPISCDDGNPCTVDACDESHKRCTHESTSSCCATDADCADTDACTANERCENGHCVSDPVACPATGPCVTGTCDPQTGCGTGAAPDGTACEDGDPCTTGETCVAGACLSRPAARAGAPLTPDLVLNRLTLSPLSRGDMRMQADAWFSASEPIDPLESGITLQIRDAQGTIFYKATIPGSAFSTNRRRSWFLYSAVSSGQQPYDGLRRLELRGTRPGTFTLNARGIVPRFIGNASLTPTTALAQHGAQGSFALAIWVGDACVRDQGVVCAKGKGGTKRCK